MQGLVLSGSEKGPHLNYYNCSLIEHELLIYTVYCVTDRTTQPGSEGRVICLTIYLLINNKVITQLLIQLVYNPGLKER